MKRESGFTLLELLIAISIVVILSITTSQAVIKANNIRDKLEQEAMLYNGIQITLSMMTKDITHAFNREVQQPLQRRDQKPDEVPSTPLPQPREDDTKRAETNFFGEKSELHFTALAHARLYEEAAESKFSEVGYFLERNKEGENLYTLMRREALFPDGEVREGGATESLAENVRSMTLKYYDKKNDRWESKWDTTHMDFKHKFPDAVQIELTMVDSKGKEVTFQTTAMLLLTNNG